MADVTVLDAATIETDPDTFSADTQPVPGGKRNVPLTITTSADRVGAKLKIEGVDADSDGIKEHNIDISEAYSSPVTSTMRFATVNVSGIIVSGMEIGDTLTLTHPEQDAATYSFPVLEGIATVVGEMDVRHDVNGGSIVTSIE